MNPITEGRVLYLTVSGSWLYGFAGPKSDVDVHGAYRESSDRFLGILTPPTESYRWKDSNGVEGIIHEIGRELRFLLNGSGNSLEDLVAPPYDGNTSIAHQELLEFVPRLVNKKFANHCLGFAESEWREITKPMQAGYLVVKKLLYAFRILLFGRHLMQTGQVVSNINLLKSHLSTDLCSLIDDLLARKHRGEARVLDLDRLMLADYLRGQIEQLEEERDASQLPAAPPADVVGDLERWLLVLREKEIRRDDF